MTEGFLAKEGVLMMKYWKSMYDRVGKELRRGLRDELVKIEGQPKKDIGRIDIEMEKVRDMRR